MKMADDIKGDMDKFDRLLADSMKPLTDFNDIQNGKSSLYNTVLDKMTTTSSLKPENALKQAEDLKSAVDKLQIQLKRQVQNLQAIDNKINIDF